MCSSVFRPVVAALLLVTLLLPAVPPFQQVHAAVGPKIDGGTVTPPPDQHGEKGGPNDHTIDSGDTPVAASRRHVVVHNGADTWTCDAPVEFSGNVAMVGARSYAACLGLYYRWNADESTFYLANSSVAARFTLGSDAVRSIAGEREDLWDLGFLAVQPYEQQGTLYNMMPLRFFNDLFGWRTDWDGKYGFHVYLDRPAEVPDWDLSRVSALLQSENLWYRLSFVRAFLDSQWVLAPAWGGWDIMPSTQQWLASVGTRMWDDYREMRDGSPDAIMRLDWVSSRVTVYGSNGKPAVERAYKQDASQDTVTLWYWSHDEVGAALTRLDAEMIDSALLNGGLALGNATLATLIGIAGVTGAGVVAAVIGAGVFVFVGMYEHAQLQKEVSRIERCYVRADKVWDLPNNSSYLEMGIRVTGDGDPCLTKYTP